MRGHITSEELHRLSTGSIEGESLLEIDRHLDACTLCARRAEELTDLDALAAAMRGSLSVGDEHPGMTELIGYAEGELDEAARQWVGGHLESCARCREDVDDLRLEQENLRGGGRGWWWLAAGILIAAFLGAAAMWLGSGPSPAGKPPGVGIRTSTGVGPVPQTDAWTDLEESVRAAGKIDRPSVLDSLGPRGDRFRGSETGDVAELHPAGEVIEDDRPAFAWTPTSGAHYVVTIFANEEPVATSEPLRAAEWRAPQPLRRGMTYNWQVEVRSAAGSSAIIPTPPQPEALFRIADAETVASINTARRAHPDDHLLSAILYARAGMKSLALAELSAHLVAHPSDVRAAALADGIRKW
jgi:hypothetical protein